MFTETPAIAGVSFYTILTTYVLLIENKVIFALETPIIGQVN